MGLKQQRRITPRCCKPRQTLYMGLVVPGGAGLQDVYRIVDLRCYGGERAWFKRFLPLRHMALHLAAAGGANSDTIVVGAYPASPSSILK